MIHISTRTIVEYSLALAQADILDLLKDQIPKRARNIEITVTVPTDGDYSGRPITISSFAPLIVKYTIETLEES